jgi:transposase
MRETDGRRLKHDVLEALRIRAVRQIEHGESPETIIKALGMNRRTIYKWIARYREGGIDALKATPLSGRPLKLDGVKLRWIFKTVVTKNPLQLRFSQGKRIWTLPLKYPCKVLHIPSGLEPLALDAPLA